MFYLDLMRRPVTHRLIEVLRQPCPLGVEEYAVVLSIALFFVTEMGHAILSHHLMM